MCVLLANLFLFNWYIVNALSLCNSRLVYLIIIMRTKQEDDNTRLISQNENF